MEQEMTCLKCNLKLVPRQTEFIYLGKNFVAEIPACPKCGCVYVPEDFVEGRIKEVERMMEDK
jgi:uncharacterized protein with PIN domain